MLMIEGQDDDGPAPVRGDVGVNELQRQEEVLADRAPEAEVQQRLERDVAAGGTDAAEDVDRLGTDEDAGLGVAADVAER